MISQMLDWVFKEKADAVSACRQQGRWITECLVLTSYVWLLRLIAGDSNG